VAVVEEEAMFDFDSDSGLAGPEFYSDAADPGFDSDAPDSLGGTRDLANLEAEFGSEVPESVRHRIRMTAWVFG
jgi:hypothetical protein